MPIKQKKRGVAIHAHLFLGSGKPVHDKHKTTHARLGRERSSYSRVRLKFTRLQE